MSDPVSRFSCVGEGERSTGVCETDWDRSLPADVEDERPLLVQDGVRWCNEKRPPLGAPPPPPPPDALAPPTFEEEAAMSSWEVEWEGTGECFGSQGRYSFTWYSIKSSPTASCDFLLGRTGYHCLLDCLVNSAMFRWTAPRAWSWSRTLNFRTPLWTLWGTLLHRKGIEGGKEGGREGERMRGWY